MNTKGNRLRVNLCSAPSFMGHEEIVLPMLVRGPRIDQPVKMGYIAHCLNDDFQPNDLSNTAIAGYTSGTRDKGLSYPINFQQIFLGWNGDDWKKVPEITTALDALGTHYAFFLETSTDPLQDAFIARCRFIDPSRLRNCPPSFEIQKETEQITSARDILTEFIANNFQEPNYDSIYKNAYGLLNWRDRFGDPDQYSGDYVIWLEQPGVIRAWTRITYSPK